MGRKDKGGREGKKNGVVKMKVSWHALSETKRGGEAGREGGREAYYKYVPWSGRR